MNIRSKNSIKAESGMASMTDLVFLLLIFFVILSTLVSPGIQVDLPSAKNSGAPSPMQVSVGVKSDGSHYVNDQPTPVDMVEQKLQEYIAKGNYGDKKPSVILRIDKAVPTGVTVNLLDICKRNDWSAAIATKTE